MDSELLMEVKSNLVITIRERGKIVGRREGHNIWLHVGRVFLAKVMSLSAWSSYPGIPDARIRYMGFGIGSDKASSGSYVGTLGTDYPGTNVYNDQTPQQDRIERPVRIAWSGSPTAPTGTYPNLVYPASDVFLKEVEPQTVEPVATSRTFRASFADTDFNGTSASPGDYWSVPISEIGLYLNIGTTNPYQSLPYRQGIAGYDSFDPFNKTQYFGFDVVWTVRF